jgi:hypothetical protein
MGGYMMLQRVDSDTTTHNRHGSRTFLLTFLVRSQLSMQSLDKLELTSYEIISRSPRIHFLK